jgi:hypothetical protein
MTLESVGDGSPGASRDGLFHALLVVDVCSSSGPWFLHINWPGTDPSWPSSFVSCFNQSTLQFSTCPFPILRFLFLVVSLVSSRVISFHFLSTLRSILLVRSLIRNPLSFNHLHSYSFDHTHSLTSAFSHYTHPHTFVRPSSGRPIRTFVRPSPGQIPCPKPAALQSAKVNTARFPSLSQTRQPNSTTTPSPPQPCSPTSGPSA